VSIIKKSTVYIAATGFGTDLFDFLRISGIFLGFEDLRCERKFRIDHIASLGLRDSLINELIIN